MCCPSLFSSSFRFLLWRLFAPLCVPRVSTGLASPPNSAHRPFLPRVRSSTLIASPPPALYSHPQVYRETDKRADRHNPLPAAPKSPPRSAAKQPKPRKSPPPSAHEITTDPHDQDNHQTSSSSSSVRPSLAKLEPPSPQASFAQGSGGSHAWPSAQPHAGTSSDGGDSLEMDFGELASGAVAGIELGSPIKTAALTEQEVEDEAEAARQAARTSEKARERQLVGSLTTTYRFKGPCLLFDLFCGVHGTS